MFKLGASREARALDSLLQNVVPRLRPYRRVYRLSLGAVANALLAQDQQAGSESPLRAPVTRTMNRVREDDGTLPFADLILSGPVGGY